MTLYASTLQMKKLLVNLDGWLVKARAHADAKRYDSTVLMNSRLAPDMFPMGRQVQAACDAAKYGAARVAGKEAPAHADDEKSLDDLRKRIASVVAYLNTFKESDFAGADSRIVSLPRWEGKSMTAPHYFIEHALPNFYFHLTMAYALLRHNGVEVGKRDYLGELTMR